MRFGDSSEYIFEIQPLKYRSQHQQVLAACSPGGFSTLCQLLSTVDLRSPVKRPIPVGLIRSGCYD